MVKPFDEAMAKGISITKYRIKHMEKHGNGKGAMREKQILQEQQRHLQKVLEARK